MTKGDENGNGGNSPDELDQILADLAKTSAELSAEQEKISNKATRNKDLELVMTDLDNLAATIKELQDQTPQADAKTQTNKKGISEKGKAELDNLMEQIQSANVGTNRTSDQASATKQQNVPEDIDTVIKLDSHVIDTKVLDTIKKQGLTNKKIRLVRQDGTDQKTTDVFYDGTNLQVKNSKSGYFRFSSSIKPLYVEDPGAPKTPVSTHKTASSRSQINNATQATSGPSPKPLDPSRIQALDHLKPPTEAQQQQLQNETATQMTSSAAKKPAPPAPEPKGHLDETLEKLMASLSAESTHVPPPSTDTSEGKQTQQAAQQDTTSQLNALTEEFGITPKSTRPNTPGNTADQPVDGQQKTTVTQAKPQYPQPETQAQPGPPAEQNQNHQAQDRQPNGPNSREPISELDSVQKKPKGKPIASFTTPNAAGQTAQKEKKSLNPFKQAKAQPGTPAEQKQNDRAQDNQSQDQEAEKAQEAAKTQKKWSFPSNPFKKNKITSPEELLKKNPEKEVGVFTRKKTRDKQNRKIVEKANLKPMVWQQDETDKNKPRTVQIKDANGKTAVDLEEKTKQVFIGGKTVICRDVNLPTELKNKDTGPLTVSLALKGEDGTNMPKKDAVYFVGQYNKEGKLVDVRTPKPVKVAADGKTCYIERNGQKYTLPVNKETFDAMQKEAHNNNKEHKIVEAHKMSNKDTVKEKGKEQKSLIQKTSKNSFSTPDQSPAPGDSDASPAKQEAKKRRFNLSRIAKIAVATAVEGPIAGVVTAIATRKPSSQER